MSGPYLGERDRGRRGRRDRPPGRTRSSRSRSPADKPSLHPFRRPDSEPETPSLSACLVCLSRKPHKIRSCQATLLWDGKHKSRCTRTIDGRVVDATGRPLCYNWNQTMGCKDKSARHLHECSGCGDASHGAQDCNLAEKASPPDTSHR